MKRKCLYIYLGMLVGGIGMCILLYMSIQRTKQAFVKKIFIDMKGHNIQLTPIQQAEMIQWINMPVPLTSKKIGDIYLVDIQNNLLKYFYWIQSASLYIDSKDNLHVMVVPYVPIARLFFAKGDYSCFIDTSFHLIPISPDILSFYASYSLPLFTNAPNDIATNVFDKNMKAKIVEIAQFIYKDSFWNSQIQQINIDSAHCFTLIPLVGNNDIYIGYGFQLATEMNHVLMFYKSVIPRVGMNYYKEINVSIPNQIIATIANDKNNHVFVSADSVHKEITHATTYIPPALLPIRIKSMPIVKRQKEHPSSNKLYSKVKVPKAVLKKNKKNKKNIPHL